MKRGVLILVAFGIGVWLFGKTPQSGDDGQVKAQAVEQKPIEETAEQKAQKARKAAEQEQWVKDVLLIRALRNKMKNPATFKLENALRMKDGTLCLTYRAANSFNAIILERAVIDTKTTGASTEVTAWNKYCGGKTGTDISYIKSAI
jgi:hypothetical protein